MHVQNISIEVCVYVCVYIYAMYMLYTHMYLQCKCYVPDPAP